MTDYLNTPQKVKLEGIAPIYLALVTEIFQRGIDEDTEFPVVFDYKETDKETRKSKMLASFAVTKSKAGILTVKKVKGKARQAILKKD